MEDITPHAHGIELLIRRSKTDQEGEGRTVFVPLAKSEERCPVKALERCLELAVIGEGPLFRPVNRHDRVVSAKALTPQSVALVVKSAVGKSKGVDAAKLDSGHSLRAGFVTEAAMVGMQTSVIMGQTGHKSIGNGYAVHQTSAEASDPEPALKVTFDWIPDGLKPSLEHGGASR